jgi:hypothetical protein
MGGESRNLLEMRICHEWDFGAGSNTTRQVLAAGWCCRVAWVAVFGVQQIGGVALQKTFVESFGFQQNPDIV